MVSGTPEPPPARVAFFGTPAFAVPALEQLVRSHHRVVGVVTQPDRPSGRGQRRAEGPVKQAALAHGLPVLQPDRLQAPDVLEAFRAWQADIGVVAAYGRILPPALLDLPRFGMVNIHASLLPKYRGAAPIQRAVVAGEIETGVTIMRLGPELDAGPMLAARAVPIGPDETSEALERDLAVLGATLLASTLDDIVAGRAVETPQDPARATYAPRLAKSEGLIDWAHPARQIHNLIRGLHPWPHAFTYLDGVRCVILTSRLLAGRQSADELPAPAPGEVWEASGDRLIVQCGGGDVLSIVELQRDGRRVQTAREFVSGRGARRGQMFGPPASP